MSNKWRNFHSQYSPIEAGKIDTGNHDAPQDWKRLCNENASINGIPLKSYSKKYNDFKTTEDLKQFFIEVILKDVKNEATKASSADYLLTAFHQGGLMYPISGSLSVLLSDNGLQERHTRKDNRTTNITTTEHGFKIQEIYTIDKVNFVPSDIYPDYDDERKRKLRIIQEKQDRILHEGRLENEPVDIGPDTGNVFVIEAGATIDVDFSGNPQSPDVTIESNYISYGNEKVKSVLDTRNFIQVIIDFCRNIFGLNSVKEMPSTTPDEQHDTSLRY